MKIGKYITSKAALIVLLACMAITTNVYSAPRIKYSGMVYDKASIWVNGHLKKLAFGETSKAGVTLLSATPESIVILVDGKRYRYKKYSSQGTILADNVTLIRDPGSNGYWAKGRINGKDVTFLIDTGASCVVINKEQARAWKIKRGNTKIQVSTATKKETAYQVTLDTVSIGDLEFQNITAIITQHKYPPYPLLGMSFLRHVEMSQANGQMILKYSAR